jgi:hypothetical protein
MSLKPHQPAMRSALAKMGLVLCFAAVALCVFVHLATFLTTVSLAWIIPPFLLVTGAVLCSKGIEEKARIGVRPDKVAMLGWLLLTYAVCCFIYDYKTTGGATSVGIVDGHYVSMYKNHVITVITENEYRMFPNL